jgi:hypothetical protein
LSRTENGWPGLRAKKWGGAMIGAAPRAGGWNESWNKSGYRYGHGCFGKSLFSGRFFNWASLP